VALTNAEKQARWRDRNVVVLTGRASDIAGMLIERLDQKELRKVAAFIRDHLKNPDRTPMERAIALGKVGMSGLNGPLSPKAALKAHRAPKPDGPWRVEAITKDGTRWQSGVRLATKEEAEVYAEWYAKLELQEQGYVTAEVIRCDSDDLNCSISRRSRRPNGRPTLVFPDGSCVLLGWHQVPT
jgi:hypothetical protein